MSDLPTQAAGQAYQGVRILDFSQVIAGPVATQLLNSLGAQIIKIEAPDKGDQLRRLVLSARQDQSRDSAAFNAMNRGKQSICLNLKSPEGRATALRMARECDVIVENFRPGVMKRLGLDYETIKAERADIIYCSVSGYGQQGPLSSRPAYDSAIQAASGMMSNTGHASTGPTRTGYTPVDISAGLLASFAISSALLRRERSGAGQYLDVSMLDAAMLLQMTSVAASLDDGGTPGLNGNASPAHSLTANCFEAKDGFLILSALTAKHGEAVMHCLNLPVAHWHEYMKLSADAPAAIKKEQAVAQAFSRETVDHWGQKLLALGVAFERVNNVLEATQLSQQKHRHVIDTDESAGIRSFGGAFMANADGPSCDRTVAPELGQQTRSVLLEFGFSADEIETLTQQGAFTQ